MQEVATIGLDLAKQVFQAHGATSEGAPLFSRKLRRAEVLRFSRSCRDAWSAWKRAAVLTTGRARSRHGP